MLAYLNDPQVARHSGHPVPGKRPRGAPAAHLRRIAPPLLDTAPASHAAHANVIRAARRFSQFPWGEDYG